MLRRHIPCDDCRISGILECHYPRKRHREPQPDQVPCQRRVAREAMEDPLGCREPAERRGCLSAPVGETLKRLPDDADRLLRGVPRVDHDGEILPGGDPELSSEHPFLDIAWCEIVVKIEPDLADGHNLPLRAEILNPPQDIIAGPGRLMRMHPHACVDSLLTMRELHRPPAVFQRGRGIDDGGDAGIGGTRNHLVAVGVKLTGREVCMCVNEHGPSFPSFHGRAALHGGLRRHDHQLPVRIGGREHHAV